MLSGVVSALIMHTVTNYCESASHWDGSRSGVTKSKLFHDCSMIMTDGDMTIVLPVIVVVLLLQARALIKRLFIIDRYFSTFSFRITMFRSVSIARGRSQKHYNVITYFRGYLCITRISITLI